MTTYLCIYVIVHVYTIRDTCCILRNTSLPTRRNYIVLITTGYNNVPELNYYRQPVLNNTFFIVFLLYMAYMYALQERCTSILQQRSTVSRRNYIPHALLRAYTYAFVVYLHTVSVCNNYPHLSYNLHQTGDMCTYKTNQTNWNSTVTIETQSIHVRAFLGNNCCIRCGVFVTAGMAYNISYAIMHCMCTAYSTQYSLLQNYGLRYSHMRIARMWCDIHP